jgi:hypothetical protein
MGEGHFTIRSLPHGEEISFHQGQHLRGRAQPDRAAACHPYVVIDVVIYDQRGCETKQPRQVA